MKFAIYSHENYFLPIVPKFKSPYIWADMKGDEAEPEEKEPIDLKIKAPTKVPDDLWSDFFHAKSEERRLLQGKGIVKRHDADEVTKKLLELSEEQKKGILVIFDFNHGVKYGEKLKKAGFKGIFAQQFFYELERKREKAAQLVQKFYKEVKVPRQVKFGKGSADKMIQFLEKEQDTVWVVKPNGEGVLVFCPQSEDAPIALGEDIGYIQGNKDAVNGIPMILQEKVIGVEINIETDYCNGLPIASAVDLENKYMETEETGKQCGCSYDLVFFIPLNCKLRQMVNAPFDKIAKKLNFTGLMDINVIFSHKDGKPYWIEFCPNRFGYNSLFTQMEIYGKSPDEYLKDLVNGKFKPPMDKFGASVKLFNRDQEEDFRHSIFKPDYENVLLQIKDDSHLWSWEIYKDGKEFKMPHYSHEAFVVTDSSDTPEGAICKTKLRAMRDIDFDGKYFRADIDLFDRSYNPVYRYKYLRDRKLLEANGKPS